MRITDLFLRLRVLLALGVLAVLASTLLAHWPGLDLGGVPGRIVRELDLRDESSFGTWFESVLFLLAALSFVPLGYAEPVARHVGRPGQLLFRLAALGFVGLSADEAVRIHERLGAAVRKVGAFEGTVLDAKGFPWVVLYAPFVLLACALLAVALLRLVRALGPAARGVRWLLVAMLSGGPLVLACELAESWQWAASREEGLLGVLEEAFEVGTLVAVMALNTRLARALGS